MPIEQIAVITTAFNFLSSYIAEKGMDKLSDIIIHSNEEMSTTEHMYCVLTESLADFCEKYSIEFNENAMRDTLEFSLDRVTEFNYGEKLKLYLEKATGFKITHEELATWIEIVQEHLVAAKHEKLFRAIQLKHMEEKQDKLVAPAWTQAHMVNNSISIPFIETNFDQLVSDIQTSLSDECWISTQDLITELSLNAFQHGNAKQIVLNIMENELQISDDGTIFDINELKKPKEILRGGNWTLIQYINDYPEINIVYNVYDGKNTTTIQFPDKVFNVNGLCEITLPRTWTYNISEIQIRYPNAIARYYYVNFSDYKVARSYMCMSGALQFLSAIKEFCISRNAEVFMYIPTGDAAWDNLYRKINQIFEFEQIHKYEEESNRIHIIRE